jgi:hypothetical protein
MLKHPKSLPPAVPSLVVQVLREEHWFGENEPAWDGASLSQQAFTKRLVRIKRLHRFARNFPNATALAGLLETCAPKQRCTSGACPECIRAFQRWFVASVHYHAHAGNAQDIVGVNIELDGSLRHDSTFAFDTVYSKRAVTLALNYDPATIVWMAGALDFSLNDDSQKGFTVRCQPRLRAIVSVWKQRKFRSLLKSGFPRSDLVSRPVQVSSCDGCPQALSYAYRTKFFERVACRTQVTKDRNTRNSWTTRKLALAPPDHVRLLLWLHEIVL